MDNSWTSVVIGAALLAGYAAHVVGARTHVPRVTLLLLLGVLAGPYALAIVPAPVADWFPLIAQLALSMVGFLIGERIATKSKRGGMGRTILLVSAGEALATAIVTFLGCLAFGAPLPLALVLGGIAPATAPAAIFDVVRESRARGRLTDMLLGIVGVDDAWGVILFSLCLVAARTLAGADASIGNVLTGVWDVVGGIGVGAVLALPMAWITGRAQPGEPTLTEAAGLVFLCGGLAAALDVSYLLACMTLGGGVALFARHHSRPVHAIEGVSEPFLVVFFVLAGIKFELTALLGAGVLAAAYVLSRAIGKVAGAGLAARAARALPQARTRLGWCLLPQAGVALGLALLAQQELPEVGAEILPLIIASTVMFEILGPLLTRWQLARAGEIHEPSPDVSR